MVGAVRSLDRGALIKILTEPKNALVKQYQKVFGFEDVELEFTTDGLEAVADLALLRHGGTRPAGDPRRGAVEHDVRPAGRTDVGRVLIDADTVRDKVNPTLVPRKSSTTRPRRAAS